MSEFIRNFIANDDDRVEKLIRENPIALSVRTVADFLGMDDESVRAVLENGAIGLSWKRSGSTRHAYYIPTTCFVRWYMMNAR